MNNDQILNEDILKVIDSIDTGIPGVTYSTFVRQLFRPLAPAAMLTHAVLGMVTESYEALTATSPDNFIEECGDYLFFMVAASQQLPPVDISRASTFHSIKQLLEKAQDYVASNEDDLSFDGVYRHVFNPMLDISKRWLAYDKAPSEEQAHQLMSLALGGFVNLYCPNMELFRGDETDRTVLDTLVRTNVAKLRHRYREGFSTEAALNRDLQGEMNALGSAQG